MNAISPNPPLYPATATIITKMLDDANLTQSEVARRLGVSRAYISMLARGRTKPSLRILAKIAHHCGRDMKIMLGDIEVKV